MWYERDGIFVTKAKIFRDNIIDLEQLESYGSYTDSESRRWAVIDGNMAKIISLKYHTGFDSFNVREDEVINKYLNDEYVTLLKVVTTQDELLEWDGTVGIFNE